MARQQNLMSGTRALKNAKFLQSHLPNLFPAEEPVEGFGSLISSPILSRLHLSKDFTEIPAKFRESVRDLKMPIVQSSAQSPLFRGTLHVVRIIFQINPTTAISVSAADVTTAIGFLNLATRSISAYASAYGDDSLSVSQTVLNFSVSLPTSRYNDQTLQGWVNTIANQKNLDANSSCLVVLNPNGVTNTDGDHSKGILGYHGKANLPYCFDNVFGQNLTIDDAADSYAWQLSHEVAEMTVDPDANDANPEVCDPCGPNCPPDWRCFFDTSGDYIGTSSGFPPGFNFAFFINAIVEPAFATQCPAPQAACSYRPPGAEVATPPGALILYPGDQSAGKFFMGTADGRLFENYWDETNKVWAWTNHGTPPGTKVATAPGALILYPGDQSAGKFFMGTADGRLFENYWDETNKVWAWTNHGAPPGTKVATAPGALILYPGDQSAGKFFMGTADGRLFENYWDETNKVWAWTDHGSAWNIGV